VILLVVMAQEFGQTLMGDKGDIAAEDQKVAAKVTKYFPCTSNRMTGAELLLLGYPSYSVFAARLPHLLRAIPNNDHHFLRLQALGDL
jgi:hypothetical protein